VRWPGKLRAWLHCLPGKGVYDRAKASNDRIKGVTPEPCEAFGQERLGVWHLETVAGGIEIPKRCYENERKRESGASCIDLKKCA